MSVWLSKSCSLHTQHAETPTGTLEFFFGKDVCVFHQQQPESAREQRSTKLIERQINHNYLQEKGVYSSSGRACSLNDGKLMRAEGQSLRIICCRIAVLCRRYHGPAPPGSARLTHSNISGYKDFSSSSGDGVNWNKKLIDGKLWRCAGAVSQSCTDNTTGSILHR